MIHKFCMILYKFPNFLYCQMGNFQSFRVDFGNDPFSTRWALLISIYNTCIANFISNFPKKSIFYILSGRISGSQYPARQYRISGLNYYPDRILKEVDMVTIRSRISGQPDIRPALNSIEELRKILQEFQV